MKRLSRFDRFAMNAVLYHARWIVGGVVVLVVLAFGAGILVERWTS